MQLDTTSQTFLGKVDDQYRLLLSQSNSNQASTVSQSVNHHLIVLSKLDAIHDDILKDGRTKQLALSTLQDSQRQIIRGQRISVQTASRTRKSNAQARCPLTNAKANVAGVRIHDGRHVQNLSGDSKNDTQQSQRIVRFLEKTSTKSYNAYSL
jgi:hypothetical protein